LAGCPPILIVNFQVHHGFQMSYNVQSSGDRGKSRLAAPRRTLSMACSSTTWNSCQFRPTGPWAILVSLEREFRGFSTLLKQESDQERRHAGTFADLFGWSRPAWFALDANRKPARTGDSPSKRSSPLYSQIETEVTTSLIAALFAWRNVPVTCAPPSFLDPLDRKSNGRRRRSLHLSTASAVGENIRRPCCYYDGGTVRRSSLHPPAWQLKASGPWAAPGEFQQNSIPSGSRLVCCFGAGGQWPCSSH